MNLTMSLVIWIGICILAIILEAATVQLVSIWFAIGAVGAAVSAMFTDNFYIQLAVFLALSAVLLVATIPIVKKMRKKDSQKLNLDSAVGKIVVLTKEIPANDKGELGEVRVDGKVWTAQNETNEIIPANSNVIITAIKGCRLIVKPYNKKENVK